MDVVCSLQSLLYPHCSRADHNIIIIFVLSGVIYSTACNRFEAIVYFELQTHPSPLSSNYKRREILQAAEMCNKKWRGRTIIFLYTGQLLSVLMTVRNHVGVVPESTCTVSKTDSAKCTWDIGPHTCQHCLVLRI